MERGKNEISAWQTVLMTVTAGVQPAGNDSGEPVCRISLRYSKKATLICSAP